MTMHLKQLFGAPLLLLLLSITGTAAQAESEWSDFGEWTQCSASCGGGTQERTRTCNNPEGTNCDGAGSETQGCNTNPCPIESTVDGGWSDFGEWSSCSAPCEGGDQIRTRQCNNPAPQFGGQDCVGADFEHQLCNRNPCPVDGEWSDFSEWSSCSASCGGGTQSRERQCNNPEPQFGGQDCVGGAMEEQQCNTNPCPIESPVDGGWSDFGEWSSCSAPCAGGDQIRERQCNNPEPQFGGQDCVGADFEHQLCNTNPCPVDGEWSDFSEWSSCSASCAGGTQSRERQCNNPAPQFGGLDCVGGAMESQQCNTNPCPVDGGWSDFSEWSSCSTTCGGGIQIRIRQCNNPAPQFGGQDCDGDSAETQACADNPCPAPGYAVLDEGDWSECSAACGGGTQVANGTCVLLPLSDPPALRPNEFCGNGSPLLERECNTHGCSGDVDMDPHFRDWQGRFWDYHGVCDMVFLHSKDFGQGKGLRIHIRTKDRYGYSFIESAVVKIGQDLLEVSSYGDYSLNGVVGADLEGIFMGGSHGISHTMANKKRQSFNITVGEEEQIVLTTFKDMVGVHLKGASRENFGESVGLMGKYGTGEKVGRDGSTVMEEDPIAFGQEWQVLNSEPALFQTAREPQYPVQCFLPKAGSVSRRLGQGKISKEKAEEACSHWVPEYKSLCVMDVLATQDIDAAKVGPGAY